MFSGGESSVDEYEEAPDTAEEILDLAQQSLDELQGEENEIGFSKAVALNEAFDIKFRLRDYENAPKDYETFAELEAALVSLIGNLSFKVTEIGTIDKINDYTVAAEGKTFYYFLFEFKGDTDNPESLTIHPRNIDESGWDPAPQFVAIMNGEDKRPSISRSNNLMLVRDIDSPNEFTVDSWLPYAAVWELPVDAQPIYALKFIDPDGVTTFIKVTP